MNEIGTVIPSLGKQIEWIYPKDFLMNAEWFFLAGLRGLFYPYDFPVNTW